MKEKKTIISNLFSAGYFKILQTLILFSMIIIVQFIVIIIQVININKMSKRFINTPFILEVDSRTKETLNTTIIDDEYNIDEVREKQIENKLSEVITFARSIPTDKDFYQKNLNRIQAYFTREAGEQLRESLKSNQVAEKLNNRESVSVNIDSIIKLERRKRKYQVMWTENYYTMGGDTIVKKYIAIIDVILVDVKSKEMMKNNPFGIMIQDINISETNSK